MSTGGVTLGGSYDEARTRKTTAEAELAELQLRTAKGNLVHIDEVVKTWENILGEVKGKLQAMPSKLAPLMASEVDANVCKHVLEDTINEALMELSEYDPITEAQEGATSAKATTKVKRKSVGRSVSKT